MQQLGGKGYQRHLSKWSWFNSIYFLSNQTETKLSNIKISIWKQIEINNKHFPELSVSKSMLRMRRYFLPLFWNREEIWWNDE